MGLRALGNGSSLLYSAYLLVLIGLAAFFFGIRREANALAIVGFLAVADPIFRSNVRGLPFLTLSYAALGWALIVILNRGGSLRLTLPLMAYSLYALIEIFGVPFSDSAKLVRGVLVPSLGIVAFLLIGHCVKINSEGVVRIVTGVLIGGIGLLGHLGYLYAFGGAAQWGKQSNFEASGGAGPVQISFVLSVAAFLAFWCAERSRNWTVRITYGGICIILLSFMLLTFSRGGIYIFSGAVVVYVIFQKKPSLRSIALLVVSIAIVCGTGYFVDNVTDGAFQQRFSDVKTTRVDLVLIGWKIFNDNFLFGVGTGAYYTAVEPYFGVQSGAHNEVIRAAAEHGLFGIILWLMFYFGSVWQILWGQRGVTRALRLALLAIFLASVFHNGLKLLMQPLLIALAFAAFPQAVAGCERHNPNSPSSSAPSESYKS